MRSIEVLKPGGGVKMREKEVIFGGEKIYFYTPANFLLLFLVPLVNDGYFQEIIDTL